MDADAGGNVMVVESVPAKVIELLKVAVLPLAIVSVPVEVVIVRPFTEVGVIAPNVSVIAGVVVGLATLPETPLAVTTETVVTVPPDDAAHLMPVASPESAVSTNPFVPTPNRVPLDPLWV